MQKKRSIKNIILKAITWAAVTVYLLAGMSYDDAPTITFHVIAMYGSLAWIGLFSIANNFFWGCE